MGIVTHDGSNATLQDYNTAWNEEDNYYNYNLETAKKKLEEAGYADGKLTLTLYCESGDLYTNISTLVQAFLNQLGINVNIEPYEIHNACLIMLLTVNPGSAGMLFRF